MKIIKNNKMRNLQILFIVMIFSIYPRTSIAQTQLGNSIYGPIKAYFGTSVDINGSGTRIALGSYNEDTLNGATRIYEIINNTWVQIGNTIVGSNGEATGFEVSFSDSGNRIAVSSLYYDEGSVVNCGRVRIFDYDGNDWVQVGSDIIQALEYNTFGHDVKLNKDGDRVAIGSTHFDVSSGGAIWGHGFVAVYKLESGDWVQIGQNIDGLANGDAFGLRLDFTDDGNRVVGLSVFSEVNGYQLGQARVFELDATNNWIQVGQTIEGTLPYKKIKTGSISSDGTRLGIASDVNRTVDMYDYDINTSSWLQVGNEITGPGSFGSTISIVDSDKNLILVGTESETLSNGYFGNLRLYSYENASWSQLGNTVYGDESEDRFGYSIGTSNDGNTLIGGAPNNDQGGNQWDNRGFVGVYTDIFIPQAIGEEIVQNNLVVYPNPATNYFKINVLNKTNNYELEVINVTGKIVKKYSEIENDMSIDISYLKNGIYFLRFSNSDNLYIKKLLVSNQK